MATKAPAIGIDLGTTKSCVAVYWKGRVEVIANDMGSRTTPSCVAFTSTERFVGEAAVHQMAMNDKNTIFDVKRLIGRKFEEDNVQADMQHWPFEVVNDNSTPKIKITHKGNEILMCPEEISAMILTKMKETAEAYLGMTVKDAVISVPTYFNESQRLATIDAGTIAGLNVLNVINEPTAAAIAYVLGKDKVGKRNILVYDLGGGSFDATILTIDAGIISVLSTSGDPHLGGEDFKGQLVNHCVEEFKKQHDKDLTTNKKALRRLRTACERAKIILSANTQTSIEIDFLFEGIDYQTLITRTKLEELNAGLFQSTLQHITQCLQDINMDRANVDEVVIVGGSTRIPKIQKLLRDFFNGKELSRSVNPDEAVACGAAVQAAILTGDDSAHVILYNVIPLSLGIIVKGGIMSTIVKRNTPIPTTQKKMYMTTNDNQTAALIAVYEGERTLVKDNCILGSSILNNIPPKPRGEVEIGVTFTVDHNGILVFAIENMTYKSVCWTIGNERRRLSKAAIQSMIEQAEKHRVEDETIKNTITAKNILQNYCYEIKVILNVEEHGLFGSDHKIILDKCNLTSDWVDSDQIFKKEEYEKKYQDLKAEYKRCITNNSGINSGALPLNENESQAQGAEEESPEQHIPHAISSTQSIPPPQPGKRKATSAIAKQNELLQKACLYLSQPTTNSGTEGAIWTEKLSKVDPTQKIFAEKAINDIIFEAQLGTLNRYSVRINENWSLTRSTTPSTTPHSASSEIYNNSSVIRGLPVPSELQIGPFGDITQLNIPSTSASTVANFLSDFDTDY